MRIVSVGAALPAHYYGQEELLEAFEALWGQQLFNPERLARLHRNVQVGGRHLALPMDEYRGLDSFTASNDAYIRCAVDLGASAMVAGLAEAGLSPSDVDHLFFVSSTGVATPSIDARLVNRLGLRTDVRRTPIFGLGCLGGVAGVARAADYLSACPGQIAVLLSVELCSLTLQREDLSVPNLVASGLFGDGAAAVVMAGADTGPGREADGPQVLTTSSVFYPDTEDYMGWRIGRDGFQIVLSAQIPDFVRERVRHDVDGFLEAAGLDRGRIARWVCHPGGPKVLEALEEALDLPPGAVDVSWETLARLGNLSSASVLMVLRHMMTEDSPARGELGVMLAMGPGFCSEMALLRW